MGTAGCDRSSSASAAGCCCTIGGEGAATGMITCRGQDTYVMLLACSGHLMFAECCGWSGHPFAEWLLLLQLELLWVVGSLSKPGGAHFG